MADLPLISIITPSFNQGRYLGETLQSLVDQAYPRLEVIIQDGGSIDGAVAIAEDFVRRHPGIFSLHVEKDNGQADALNRGFARARGEILGFLNSDDTLYPGCLASVAREINPRRGRLIVFGRCLFAGEGSIYVGVEHPAEYRSHFDQLAIWKRGYNQLPQPSVFWHRRVWDRCGGFNAGEQHVLDYDLFCRFSRHFRFHKVDELWSTYRMHADSKSSQRTEVEILEMSIAVSRRHWGPWWSPLRWRCAASLWLHDLEGHEHARHHARRCEDAVREHRWAAAAGAFLQTARYSRRLARERLLRGMLAGVRLRFLHRLLDVTEGFAGRHGDLWIGPHFRTNINIGPNARQLRVQLNHMPAGYHREVTVTLLLDRRVFARKTMVEAGSITLSADVLKHRGKTCLFEIKSSNYFTPRGVHYTPDDRSLSIQLLDFHVTTE